jgi:tetratricopeptide (TPR) repeat protein
VTQRIPFLDRDDEIARIDELIRGWNTRHVVCINAPGGFGKTRLLEEIRQRYMQPGSVPFALTVTEIIDFDDRTFHIPQIVGRKIADQLDINAFDPYLRGLVDVRSMEVAGYSSEALLEQGLAVERIFVECFNRVSAQQRVILCMDTLDALEGGDVWSDVSRLLLNADNLLLLLAGRNTRAMGEELQTETDTNVTILDLPPLSPAASERYWQQQQQMLDLTLEPSLTQTILWLTGGKPLLLELVAEWNARSIALDWLHAYDLAALQALPAEQQQQTRQEFEHQLLSHVMELSEGMDWLFLVMACVYPLDRETIARLLGLPPDEAASLFEKARQYVFVHDLSDGRITQHDEMRRMINEYVWGDIDPEGDPQRRASRISSEYLEREIQALSDTIVTLQRNQKQARADDDKEAVWNGFMALEPLEQELWTLKSQLLDHTLVIDLENGIETFARLFDEASQAYRFSFRGPLLNAVQQYIEQFSNEQQYIFLSRQARYFFDEGEYTLTVSLVTDILEKGEIQPEQQVDMLLQRANAEIRLGNVEKGIADFRQSVAISEANSFPLLIIKTRNALGWAHRLVGELDLAIRYYREAQALCLEQGTLGDDYGWILNNLTFVLSRQNHRNAIGFGRSAITHWQTLGNDIGLGAGYLVLGNAYYQSGFYDEALSVLEKSLLIFEPLQMQNWMAQIYSWRGAVYLELGDLERAEDELRGSLDIGARNIEPITLNHMGNLYLAREKYDMAERYFKRSYQRSQEVPDFVSWIGALSGVITAAAARPQPERRAELHQQVQDFLTRIKTPDGKSLGIAWFGLARLALVQHEFLAAIDLLEQGIIQVATHDSALRTDLLTQLARVERDLNQLEPNDVRQIGQTLRERFQRRETEDVVYSMVTPVMYRWAHWKQTSLD